MLLSARVGDIDRVVAAIYENIRRFRGIDPTVAVFAWRHVCNQSFDFRLATVRGIV